MRLALVAMMISALTVCARPIHVPTYQELYKTADVVVLLKVLEITETDAKTEQYGDPSFYQGYRAKCQVLSVFKGELQEATVFVPFFQHPKAMPGFNGAIPAPFSLDKNVVFLAYLKKGKAGLTPVTGEYDAGLSVKMVFDIHADNRYVKLPPHGVKSGEPDAATNGSPSAPTGSSGVREGHSQ